MSHKKVYFVTTGLADELRVIKAVKPPRLLCSYWHFKNKPLSSLCEAIGYKPEIMLDSGAYSAYTRGKHVSLLAYMHYIAANDEYITQYMALDVIGDMVSTQTFYDLMYAKGFRPIPVYHYGAGHSLIRHYLLTGAKTIALGGTVPIKNKYEVAKWCDGLAKLYPGVAFHLLGSASPKILTCSSLASCDSSAWYLQAINGRPATIPGRGREAKLARAKANMIDTMEVFNDFPVPINDSCG